MHFNEILTNPLHELGSPWQRAAPCPSRSAGGPAPPLLSGGADEVWGGVSLGPGRARAIPVGAGAGTLQPPRSCGWGGAERFPPSRRPRAAGGAAPPRASRPGREASARGSATCPCAAASRSPTPNLPRRQPLRALPRADSPPSSRQRPSLQQGCLMPARGPRQGSCLPRAFTLLPYLPHTLLPRPQEEAGHTSVCCLR